MKKKSPKIHSVYYVNLTVIKLIDSRGVNEKKISKDTQCILCKFIQLLN